MASDFGLTTCVLSPSASCKSTGRCEASRLDRGAPKPAASPASSESAGAGDMSIVRLSSWGSFTVFSPRRGLLSQDQARRPFRATILRKSAKCLQQAHRLGGAADRGAACRAVTACHHLIPCRPIPRLNPEYVRHFSPRVIDREEQSVPARQPLGHSVQVAVGFPPHTERSHTRR